MNNSIFGAHFYYIFTYLNYQSTLFYKMMSNFWWILMNFAQLYPRSIFFLTSGLVLGLRIKVGPVECTKVRSYQNTAFTKKIFHSFSMIISNFVAFSEFINFTRILQKHLDAITTFMQFRFKSIQGQLQEWTEHCLTAVLKIWNQ